MSWNVRVDGSSTWKMPESRKRHLLVVVVVVG